MENAEIVMTILNGLPRSWDSFIQEICARKKIVKFSRLWEDRSQEEARIVAQEENMGSEDQDLIVHSKKIKRDYHHPKGKHSHQKITLENLTKTYLNTDALHVMREDTLQEIVPIIRGALTRRKTKEDIMLTLQRMMNLP